MAKRSDIALEKGLPVNLDAERFVLGTAMLADDAYGQISAALQADDFAVDKHRRIYAAIGALDERGEKIDRVTVANELMRHGELASCDGLAYLVELDTGLPKTEHLDAYIRIVRDKAVLRRTVFAAQKLIERCLMAADQPGEILGEAETLLAALQEKTGQSVRLKTPTEIMESYPGGVNAFASPARHRKPGIASPWPSLNELVPSFRPGQLIIIAARPGRGKSVCAAQIAQHAAYRLNKGVALFSLEMDSADILTRMICSISAVDGFQHREGYLRSDAESRFVDAMRKLGRVGNLWIDDTTGCTVSAIRAAARKKRATAPLELILVDYLQLMKALGHFDNRVSEVTAISRGLKLLARELQAAIVALSQLSRAAIHDDNKPPELHHLRESGAIEADADVVIMQHAKGKPNDKIVDTQFFVRKQRGGPEGVRTLVFNKPYSRFEDPKWNEQGTLGEDTESVETSAAADSNGKPPSAKTKRQTPVAPHWTDQDAPPWVGQEG